MAVLPVNSVSRAGLSEASLFNACTAGGDLLPNDGRQWVEIINASGGAITVTANGYIDGANVAVKTYSIPATTGRFKIGPFPPGTFNNASNQVSLTYSAVTTLTIAAFTLG
mgnify:CR=1 FL=1